MAEPIIVDYIPELTGSRQPSRLRSMQDNIPEKSPRGGTATLERPRNTDSIYTLSLDEVENDDVREHLKGVDERTEAEGNDPTTEDLKREYKSIKKLVQFYEDRKELGENSARAAESRRVRLINRLKSKGVETDEIRKYLVKVDLEVKRELELEKVQAQKDQRREEIDAYIRQEKGYPANKQVTDAERLEVQRQLQQEELRRRGLLPDDEDEDDEEGVEQKNSRRNSPQSRSGVNSETNDMRYIRGRLAAEGKGLLDSAFAAWRLAHDGAEPDPRQKWEIVQQLREERELQEEDPEVIEGYIRIGKEPGPEDERKIAKDERRANRELYGKLPQSIQEWADWVIQGQNGELYGERGPKPLYYTNEKGEKIIQPHNILEWFHDQMLLRDEQSGDENAVDFWQIGVPMPNGSEYPISRMQNLPKAFFYDSVNRVVLKDLLDQMVFEVWQANAARNLFQVNDFLKESDTAFFEQFGKVMQSNFLTKPGAISLFALPGMSPKERMDPGRMIDGGKGFENQQTGQAIRAALLTYGYLGDFDTLKQIWGTDSSMFNNKEFVKSYHAANWDRDSAAEKYRRLPDVQKRKEDGSLMSLEEYLLSAEKDVINAGRKLVLLAKSDSLDLDAAIYNNTHPDFKGTQGANPRVNLEVEKIFKEDGTIKNEPAYLEHLENMFREAIPFNEIRSEIHNRIIYSLTQGSKVQVDNPNYNPKYIPLNGEVHENPQFDKDKPIDNQKKIDQLDSVSLTSAKYGVRLALFLEPLWLHEQDPTGRAQRAGAKLTRNERNAVRSGETVRLGTPGNVASIGTMRVLGISPLEAIQDNQGYTIAERLRGSDKGKVNINLRKVISYPEISYPKDAMKAYYGDSFKRGASLYEKRTKGSLFSGLASAVKRDFFQGIITDHHKIDELIHDGIGKDIQYFVTTYGGVDYSKEERVRDETSKGNYITISNAERFFGYDVLDRDKYHMKIADTAYIDEINRRIHEKYHNLHGEEFEKARAEELAKLPRNTYGEILVHDGKPLEHGHGHGGEHHHDTRIQRDGDRARFGTYKWKEIDEEVIDHKTHEQKQNALRFTPFTKKWSGMRTQGRQHMIDAQLVQNVERNLLWKEVLKAEIVNSLIEHRMRSSGHEYFDWEVSQRIIDLLRFIPADAEKDPVTGKYHWHGTLFSKEDVDWIQKKAKMGHLMRGELGKQGFKETVGGIFDILNQLMAYTFK